MSEDWLVEWSCQNCFSDPRQCPRPPPHMPPPHMPPPNLPYSAQHLLPPHHLMPHYDHPLIPKADTPREIRNKAEKQRRDKLNQSVAELSSTVPPVMASSRKIDKTGVLRLTAHYLRSHQYVFGDSIDRRSPEFSGESALALLSAMKGFLITVTYKGIFVVVSQNVKEYIGFSEMDLLGNSMITLTHEDDRAHLRSQLMPNASGLFGPNGELVIPEDSSGVERVKEILAKEKRNFVIRLKKLTHRSEPAQFMSCVVEGSFRKSDRACRGNRQSCQMVRRARARGDNPCSSGNDVVFIGVVRPTVETFKTESNLEVYRMEYRTRHSVDGEIIQAEQKIALVTGYIPHEVYGLNAMNFMHRDDVRWVIIALREMYDTQCLIGESAYRLMSKNGTFIFLQTRGHLEVDSNSGVVTTFVCTNTLVDEKEGMHLINMMKKKFTVMINTNEDHLPEENTEESDSEDQQVRVEDPKKIEKVILHLVTNLPSPESAFSLSTSSTSDDQSSPNPRLFFIPPRKERIVSSIEKIYNVIKDFDNNTTTGPKITEINSIDPRYFAKETVTTSNQTEHGGTEKSIVKSLEFNQNYTSMQDIKQDQAMTFNDTEASTSFGSQMMATKRPSARVDDEFMFKRMVFDTDGTDFPHAKDVKISQNEIKTQDEITTKDEIKPPDDYIEDFDFDCIDELLSDSELDNALNILQAMDSPIGSPKTFPEMLYDADFQSAFGNLENTNVNEDTNNESSKY